MRLGTLLQMNTLKSPERVCWSVHFCITHPLFIYLNYDWSAENLKYVNLFKTMVAWSDCYNYY